jgi:mannosyltransferase
VRTMRRSVVRVPWAVSTGLLLAILLLAAGLRFYRLDAQSFWNDEGNSARIAERTLDLILEGAEGDIHPPGYYLLLHYWRAPFGESEFALRSLSVVSGLALVVFTYLLGRHLFGRIVGLIGAFLGAVSPFAIYYSQEARMYALLGALSAISTYLLFRLLASSQIQPSDSDRHPSASSVRRPSGTILALYTLVSVAGLYTHYAFPLVLIAHNLVVALEWLFDTRHSVHRWRWLALWAGIQIAIVVLYLPWLPIALKSVTGWSSAGRAYELGPALLDVLRVLCLGITLPVERAIVSMVISTLLLLLGLWPFDFAPRPARGAPQDEPFDLAPRLARRAPQDEPRRSNRATWLGFAGLALCLLLPIGLIFGFDLYKPEWLKFLIVVLPPFHVLLARGIETLCQFGIRSSEFGIPLRLLLLVSCLVVLASCLLPLGSSLQNLYLDPAYARDDYRQIAADIAASTRPGDAVILNAPNQWEVFTYYYPEQAVYPAPYRPEPDGVERFLAPLLEQERRLFVLYWGDAESDPQRLVETDLANRAYKAGDRWYGRVRLSTYAVAPLPEEPDARLDAQFGASIRLTGFAQPQAWFAPGDILPVTLFWRAEGPISERYKFTVQLLDGAGQLVAQHDSEPVDGLSPTSGWISGDVITDRHGVSLPHDLPAGRYTLIVGLYHIATGERLAVGDGTDHVSLCEVHIRAPTGFLPRDLPNTTYQRLRTVQQSTPALSPTSPGCTTWSGLTHNIRDGLQDADSRWVLTEAGLLRFDLNGKLLSAYTRPGRGPVDWGMLALASDGKGGVWIASHDGVWWLHDDQWTQLLVTDHSVSQLAVDLEGDLWVATHVLPAWYANMYGIRSCTHDNRPPGHSGPTPPTTSVLYHYVGDGAWQSWAGQTGVTPAPAAIALPDHCQRWAWVSPAEMCPDASHPAPAPSDIEGWIEREENNLDLLPPSYLGDIHRTLVVDDHGTVWADRASSSGGLIAFEQGQWSLVTIEGAVEGPCERASTISQDAAGYLWIGSEWGVCRWREGQVSMTAELGSVASLVQDWEGYIWAGLVRGGVARWDGSAWTRFDAAEGALPSDLVTAMAVDTRRQRLYVGTHGGLAVFDGQAWRLLDSVDTDRGLLINALAVAEDGSLWVGYYQGPTETGAFDGALRHVTDTGWEHVSLPVQGAVGALLVDREGGLWVGLILSGFSGRNSFYHWQAPPDEAALWNYRDGAWHPVGRSEGLGHAAMFALAEDPDGVIWAAGATSISATDPARLW